jgi:acyl-CoA dehydrogenase family protein 9
MEGEGFLTLPRVEFLALLPTERIQKFMSYMKSLFLGEIRHELLFPYPALDQEGSESLKMILEGVDRYAKDSFESAKWDMEGAIPKEILHGIAELGLMGLAVPEEYQGLGLPQMSYVRVMEQVASHDSSLAVTLGAHQSIGYKSLLLFGTEAQKQKYLPALATGEKIACFCLTEPGSGSDAASIKTKAVLSSDGTHYLLSGNKLWITNGSLAQVMTVFAKVEVTENGEKKERVTCFIVDAPQPGISVGPAENKLGIRASKTHAIHFDQVKIPAENMVAGIGMGFKVAMGVLNHGRLGLAGGSLGLAKRALNATVLHANERVQFQKKLREFGMIKEKIARMYSNIYAAESMTYLTTNLIDRGDVDYSIESAIAKVFATEVLWDCVDENVQVWAGNGYMKEYPYEQWLRDARISRIYEGTNEILRAFIALSGMQGPGQELAGMVEAIRYPLRGLGPVTGYVARRVRQGLGSETFAPVHPRLKELSGNIEEIVRQFSSAVESLLRKHGKKIHLKQLAQKRVAEVAIDLFAMSSVLARTSGLLEKKGEEASKLELSATESFCFRALRRSKFALRSVEKNDDDLVHFLADEICERGSYSSDWI